MDSRVRAKAFVQAAQSSWRVPHARNGLGGALRRQFTRLKKRVASYFQKRLRSRSDDADPVASMDVTRRVGVEALLPRTTSARASHRVTTAFSATTSPPYLWPWHAYRARVSPRAKDRRNAIRPFPCLCGAREHSALAARVPAAHLRGHGFREPLAALPAAPDPPLHGAVHRQDRTRAVCRGCGERNAVPRRARGRRHPHAHRQDDHRLGIALRGGAGTAQCAHFEHQARQYVESNRASTPTW